LRTEAEKIQNLESEISQALEKLDRFESRKSESKTKIKSGSTDNGNEILLEDNSEQSDNRNVTRKKDSLRNFKS
jgi:hypothetical protein